MRRVTIDPITRLEGHGKIEIFLNESDNVENVYFQVPELRGFESFVVGRPVEDMPVITSRICGVCPEAHHMAATKALDDLFMVEPPPAAKKLRELLYTAFFITDHTTHFYFLGGPDFIVGPDAPAAERNLLGVMARVGADLGRAVVECRARNHAVMKELGGRAVHPTGGLPGGWSKPLSEEARRTIENVAEQNVSFAIATLKLFEEQILGQGHYRDLVRSNLYHHRFHSMGTVDEAGCPNFYDGTIRVVDPEGVEVTRYACRDYAQNIGERVEAFSYLKFPYLRKVGWRGLVAGEGSGIYVTTPLSRLNVAERMATPRAQECFQRLFETLGRGTAAGRYRPIHHLLATHWARLIELLYAAERMLDLARDPDIGSTEVRNLPSGKINPAGGIGSVEAPRGTLTHHYEADERGLVTKANLVVGTTNNYGAISIALKHAACELLNGKNAEDQALLNRLEMAFRLFDPCLSCATHALFGQMPLSVSVRDTTGEIVRTIVRD